MDVYDHALGRTGSVRCWTQEFCYGFPRPSIGKHARTVRSSGARVAHTAVSMVVVRVCENWAETAVTLCRQQYNIRITVPLRLGTWTVGSVSSARTRIGRSVSRLQLT